MEGNVFQSAAGNLYFGASSTDATRLLASIEDIQRVGENYRDFLQTRETEFGNVIVLVKELELVTITF